MRAREKLKVWDFHRECVKPAAENIFTFFSDNNHFTAGGSFNIRCHDCLNFIWNNPVILDIYSRQTLTFTFTLEELHTSRKLCTRILETRFSCELKPRSFQTFNLSSDQEDPDPSKETGISLWGWNSLLLL